MSTLRERLDGFDDEVFSTHIDYQVGWQDATRALKRVIESWAYGEKRECEVCRGAKRMPWATGGNYGCPTCHGSGKGREPGLVDRVVTKSDIAQDPVDALAAVLATLHQELGGSEHD